MQRFPEILRHALCLGVLLAVLAPAGASAALDDVGFRGPHFSGTGTQVTGAKTESKTWFTSDGTWWAAMWDEVEADNVIYRLDQAAQTWMSTGVKLDTRSGTRSDVLWDGKKLYVASHGYTNTSSPGFVSRLYRYSYDPDARTYQLDIGYPVRINDWKTESLVIDKDSTGKLWATWVQGTEVWVNRTMGDDRTWGEPFRLPVADATGLTPDDVSSIVAFGDKVGVMWSNQNSWRMNFSVHEAGEPNDKSWSAPEAANSGALNADDHINLKADSKGRVYAAVKTEQTDASAPLIQLLVRPAEGGPWARHTFGRKQEGHTRPIVLLDERRQRVHMFATSGEAGGTIYTKSASMDSISFPAGLGEPFMRDATTSDPRDDDINDATSTKQNLDASSGLLVLASNDSTNFYWHNYVSLGPIPTSADFTGAPTSGSAPLTVQFRDASTGTSLDSTWAWDFDDDGDVDSTAKDPSWTYTTAGRYTVALTVRGTTGASTTRKTDFVVVAPMVADFTASPTSGSAPLTVAFRDASTGTPTSWAWDFDNDGTVDERVQNPSWTYTTPGTYTVSLKVTDGAGNTDTKIRTGLVTVGEASSELRLSPVEDAYVRSLSPTTNYGGAGTLRVKDGGTTGEHYRSFLKFRVEGLSAPVTQATLRLYVLDPAASGGNVFTAANTWSEAGLTWEGQPATAAAPIASLGAVALDSWVEVALPAATFAAGDGTYTLAIKSPNQSGGTAWYASREESRMPQLVLATG